MSTKSFSERNEFNEPLEAEITVRYDVPEEFRGVILQIAEKCCFTPKTLRPVICTVLDKIENQYNWTEYPNIDEENKELVNGCDWWKVYDIAEAIYKEMDEPINRSGGHAIEYRDKHHCFERRINNYFIKEGIGWKMADGLIVLRGNEIFETKRSRSDDILKEKDMGTSRNEMREAFKDISRRPNPDISGAIQHSVAALECVAKKVCNSPNATFGDLLKQPNLMPKPLDKAIEKMWGYASNNGRHRTEGKEPSCYEAELIVGICASFITYFLTKK